MGSPPPSASMLFTVEPALDSNYSIESVYVDQKEHKLVLVTPQFTDTYFILSQKKDSRRGNSREEENDDEDSNMRLSLPTRSSRRYLGEITDTLSYEQPITLEDNAIVLNGITVYSVPENSVYHLQINGPRSFSVYYYDVPRKCIDRRGIRVFIPKGQNLRDPLKYQLRTEQNYPINFEKYGPVESLVAHQGLLFVGTDTLYAISEMARNPIPLQDNPSGYIAPGKISNLCVNIHYDDLHVLLGYIQDGHPRIAYFDRMRETWSHHKPNNDAEKLINGKLTFLDAESLLVYSSNHLPIFYSISSGKLHKIPGGFDYLTKSHEERKMWKSEQTSCQLTGISCFDEEYNVVCMTDGYRTQIVFPKLCDINLISGPWLNNFKIVNILDQNSILVYDESRYYYILDFQGNVLVKFEFSHDIVDGSNKFLITDELCNIYQIHRDGLFIYESYSYELYCINNDEAFVFNDDSVSYIKNQEVVLKFGLKLDKSMPLTMNVSWGEDYDSMDDDLIILSIGNMESLTFIKIYKDKVFDMRREDLVSDMSGDYLINKALLDCIPHMNIVLNEMNMINYLKTDSKPFQTLVGVPFIKLKALQDGTILAITTSKKLMLSVTGTTEFRPISTNHKLGNVHDITRIGDSVYLISQTGIYQVEPAKFNQLSEPIEDDIIKFILKHPEMTNPITLVGNHTLTSLDFATGRIQTIDLYRYYDQRGDEPIIIESRTFPNCYLKNYIALVVFNNGTYSLKWAEKRPDGMLVFLPKSPSLDSDKRLKLDKTDNYISRGDESIYIELQYDYIRYHRHQTKTSWDYLYQNQLQPITVSTDEGRSKFQIGVWDWNCPIRDLDSFGEKAWVIDTKFRLWKMGPPIVSPETIGLNHQWINAHDKRVLNVSGPS